MPDTAIPSLFPDRLTDIAVENILGILINGGARVEQFAAKTLDHVDNNNANNNANNNKYWDYDEYTRDIITHSTILSRDLPRFLQTNNTNTNTFTQTDVFVRNVEICRDFMSMLLAGPVLDKLSDTARLSMSSSVPGHVFTFSVLCNSRLGRLVGHLHTDTPRSRARNWASFVTSPTGNSLLLNCLSNCLNLSSLYLHHIATNDILYVVADSCHRLQVLDISYSSQVTDIGLVHLCGVLRGPHVSTTYTHSPGGCKYLRELYLNPQSESGGNIIMPRVIACLLRHLSYLQVADLENLHPGVDHYYRGTAGEYHHRQHRVKPLQLVHYTGSDRLAEVMDICPKLRTFKLFVTASLPDLGSTLDKMNNYLEHVTLVYSAHHNTLTGFQQFLQACGRRINQLEVECCAHTVVTPTDLIAIATYCPQIDSLAFSNFHVANPENENHGIESPVPFKPACFTFLSSLKLANVQVTTHGKEIFRYLLGGATDLETVFISFKTAGFFFSDFLLDDILSLNPLAHLQEFVLRGGALTLISALRLISSRPKLHTVGRLLHWDVEASELDTFIQILRRAKSLNLLQDISIV
jgi:hypothetical protein